MATSPSTANTSRRRFLGALAASPILGALAVPAIASAAQDDDAELLELEAEINRLRGVVHGIEATRIEPFDEEYERILRQDVTDETMKAAWAYSDGVGRSAAIGETYELFQRQIEPLLGRLFDTPARTDAGRAAKVRVLLAYMGDEWRGPHQDLDWHIQHARRLFGQFAGLTEADLAAI
jgi:hypothetical protein